MGREQCEVPVADAPLETRFFSEADALFWQFKAQRGRLMSAGKAKWDSGVQ